VKGDESICDYRCVQKDEKGGGRKLEIPMGRTVFRGGKGAYDGNSSETGYTISLQRGNSRRRLAA